MLFLEGTPKISLFPFLPYKPARNLLTQYCPTEGILGQKESGIATAQKDGDYKGNQQGEGHLR